MTKILNRLKRGKRRIVEESLSSWERSLGQSPFNKYIKKVKGIKEKVE